MPSTSPENKHVTNKPENQQNFGTSKLRNILWVVMLGLTMGCANEFIREDGTWVGSPPEEAYATMIPDPTPDTSEAEKLDKHLKRLQEDPEFYGKYHQLINLPTETVTVQPGDTLYEILRGLGFQEHELAWVAEYLVASGVVVDPNQLNVGQDIELPTRNK